MESYFKLLASSERLSVIAAVDIYLEKRLFNIVTVLALNESSALPEQCWKALDFGKFREFHAFTCFDFFRSFISELTVSVFRKL